MKTLSLPRVLLLGFLLAAPVLPSMIAEVKPGNPSTLDGSYTIEKRYDEASATWYFLTTIDHLDGKGDLIKLRLAVSTESTGEYVRTFAERTDAVLAFNASTGRNFRKSPTGKVFREPIGTQIVDGKILQELRAKRYTLGIKANNELVVYPPGTTGAEILADGSENALTAFVPLIEDHKPVADEVLNLVSHLRQKHPRQVIAQMDNLDIVFLSCGGRGFGGEGMLAMDVTRILMKRGVKLAFNLDGGGSTSTVVKGNLITEKIDKRGTQERLRPNFLYVLEN